MSQRHFEFVAGNSAKFWEVQVDDAKVTVRYGRIGTDGQTQVKTFHDSREATKHAESLIRSKVKKGYSELACR